MPSTPAEVREQLKREYGLSSDEALRGYLRQDPETDPSVLTRLFADLDAPPPPPPGTPTERQLAGASQVGSVLKGLGSDLGAAVSDPGAGLKGFGKGLVDGVSFGIVPWAANKIGGEGTWVTNSTNAAERGGEILGNIGGLLTGVGALGAGVKAGKLGLKGAMAIRGGASAAGELARQDTYGSTAGALPRLGSAVLTGGLDSLDMAVPGIKAATRAGRFGANAAASAGINATQGVFSNLGMGEAFTPEQQGANVALSGLMGVALGGALGSGKSNQLRPGESRFPAWQELAGRRAQQAPQPGAPPEPPASPRQAQVPPSVTEGLSLDQQARAAARAGQPDLDPELARHLALLQALDFAEEVPDFGFQGRNAAHLGSLAEQAAQGSAIAPEGSKNRVGLYEPPTRRPGVRLGVLDPELERLREIVAFGPDDAEPARGRQAAFLEAGRSERGELQTEKIPWGKASQSYRAMRLPDGQKFVLLPGVQPYRGGRVIQAELTDGRQAKIVGMMPAKGDSPSVYQVQLEDSPNPFMVMGSEIASPDLEGLAKKKAAERNARDQRRRAESELRDREVPSDAPQFGLLASEVLARQQEQVESTRKLTQADLKRERQKPSVSKDGGRITIEGLGTSPPQLTREEFLELLERLRAAQAGPKPTQKPLFGGRITEDQWRAFGAGPGTLPW